MKTTVLFLIAAVLAACQAPPPAQQGPLFRHGGAISYDGGYSAWCAQHRGEGSCP